MFEYMETICNFLNNTKGEINRDELAYLVAFRLGRRTYEVKQHITDRDIKIVSLEVDCDNAFGFYDSINLISDRINVDLLKENDYEIH